MADCELLYEKETPRIFATMKALQKMRYYIDHTDMEIGWLGYVSKLDKSNYLIEDVFLLKQQVHSTTTEIDPEALASLANDLIKQGEQGIALYNKIRLWGHSHVNMSTGASGQDDNQMDEFATSDYYIRLIGNKKGEWNVCLYDYDNNILWSNLLLELWYESDVSTEELDKEIADNVSKIEYTRTAGFDTSRANKKWYNDYYGFEDYDDYGYGYSYDRLKQTKEEEEEEEETPYEIVGGVTKKDFRFMKKYYSQDENTCLFMFSGAPEEVNAFIEEDFGIKLPADRLEELQVDLQKIWERKFTTYLE